MSPSYHFGAAQDGSSASSARSVGSAGSTGRASPDVRSRSSAQPPPAAGAYVPARVDTRKYYGCSPSTDYELDKKIGEGTFGEVAIGRHKATGAVVALKRILVHNEKEGIPITALREIKILKALNHPNVITLREIAYKAGDRNRRERGTVFMVFPYMDHDLTGLLENPQVRFSPGQIKSYMRQLLEGIRYLHKNRILHRDMKGSNILIDNEGHLRIADFGLARTFVETDHKGYTNMVVTRWYRPPELLMGATKYTTSIDMWGVGCVFGEMLRRRPILTGADDMDQLDKIFMLCGTPDDETWPGYRGLPMLDAAAGGLVSSFKTRHRRSILDKFPPHHYAPTTVRLLDGLLVLDPARRLTADQALVHEYFYVAPAPARPGTADFEKWPTSHELDSRLKKAEAVAAAAAMEGSGVKPHAQHLPSHFDAGVAGSVMVGGGGSGLRTGGGGGGGGMGGHGGRGTHPGGQYSQHRGGGSSSGVGGVGGGGMRTGGVLGGNGGGVGGNGMEQRRMQSGMAGSAAVGAGGRRYSKDGGSAGGGGGGGERDHRDGRDRSGSTGAHRKR
ncbi:kinase-like domain-containing protein [Entophlyctis helioformis]|nr:kinase-like domain-containing protein [Entophlyctis helioformis]